MSNYLFLDTETTGVEETDRLFEVAYIAGDLAVEALYTPAENKKMPLMATSITDVTDEMLEGKPLFKDSLEYKELELLLQTHILVAHNAKFDVDMLEKEGLKVPQYIDTLKLAHRLPEAESIETFKLNYLRHYYKIPNSGGALHRALTDTEYLRSVFEKLTGELKMTDEEMMTVTREMLIPIKIRFGMHAGKRWDELEKQYVIWIRDKSTMDQETKAVANYYLTGQKTLV